MAPGARSGAAIVTPAAGDAAALVAAAGPR